MKRFLCYQQEKREVISRSLVMRRLTKNRLDQIELITH
jgi:hypothetical protein